MRSTAVLSLSLGLAVLSSAKPFEWIDRDLRVQILSPYLVRLEVKGPKGFENRETFTVVERDWPGAKPLVSSTAEATELALADRVIRIPADRLGLRGITVHRREPKGLGAVLYRVTDIPGPSWLPSPGAVPPVHAVADSPRMVPPEGGAIPASIAGPFEATSGYDTTNNAHDLYLFLTKSYTQLRKDFLRLTGPIPMVPRYVLGYMDSRWFPYSEASALASIDDYKLRGIPLDVFVVDTDWRIGGSKGYTPDPKYFPDMKRFLSEAHARGVRVMFNDHPEPKGPAALDPIETRARYEGLSSMLQIGLDLWWFDRNWVTSLMEPMPGIRKEVWGASLFHDVARSNRPQDRPVAMSNVQGIDNGIRNYAPHPAFHRFPIYWTGDTSSQWSFLRRGIVNAVDAGVESLLPYMSEDLGGHAGTPEPEQYVRWVQFGAVSPIMRVHCTLGNDRRPWSFGAEAEQLAKEAIQFRYRLLPTLYTATRSANLEGTPLLRRLDLQWPSLPEAKAPTRYLLGDDLLVAPVSESVQRPLQKFAGMVTTPTGQAGFQVEIFQGREFSGAPLLNEVVTEPVFDWGNGAPGPNLPTDNFCARISGRIGPFAQERTFKFVVSGDDGFRLFAGDRKVIDLWKDQAEGLAEGLVVLPAGEVLPLRLEYYEGAGQAHVRLGWYDPTAPVEMPTVEAWIPPGTWRDLWTGKEFEGPRTVLTPAKLSQIPMWVREGSVLFLGEPVRADQQLRETMTVEVFPPAPGKQVTRTLYEDDGITIGHRRGEFATRDVTVSTARDGGVRVTLLPTRGSFRGLPDRRDWRIRVHFPSVDRPAGLPELATWESPGGPAEQLSQLFGARGEGVAEFRLNELGVSSSWTAAIRK